MPVYEGTECIWSVSLPVDVLQELYPCQLSMP